MNDGQGCWVRVGILYPASGLADHELAVMAPLGVTFHVTRLNMPVATRDNLIQLRKEAEEGARLLAQAQVDLLAFNCTLGSLIGGPTYDQVLAARLTALTGLKATTTATAVRAALAHLGLRRLVLVTPYVEAMNEAEEVFLLAAGHQVVARLGLGLIDPLQQASILPYTWQQHVLSMRRSDVDGYLISCSGVRVAGIIAALERSLSRPVITSQQALVWYSMRLLGVDLKKSGYGHLLES